MILGFTPAKSICPPPAFNKVLVPCLQQHLFKYAPPPQMKSFSILEMHNIHSIKCSFFLLGHLLKYIVYEHFFSTYWPNMDAPLWVWKIWFPPLKIIHPPLMISERSLTTTLHFYPINLYVSAILTNWFYVQTSHKTVLNPQFIIELDKLNCLLPLPTQHKAIGHTQRLLGLY